MAIQTLSFISLILRPYVEQPISTDGWKSLFAQVDPHRNFDGELMAFGAIHRKPYPLNHPIMNDRNSHEMVNSP